MLLEESEYGESWTVTQLMTFFLCLETVLERDRASQNRGETPFSSAGRRAMWRAPLLAGAGDGTPAPWPSRGGRAHKCHLSHEDVRGGRSWAHRRFWKLGVRSFEWARARPGAATPLSHQKGTSERAKPRTPGHPRPMWEGRDSRVRLGAWGSSKLRQEGRELPGAARMQRRTGGREVLGADAEREPSEPTSHHRQPLCWESAVWDGCGARTQDSESPLLGPRIREGAALCPVEVRGAPPGGCLVGSCSGPCSSS